MVRKIKKFIVAVIGFTIMLVGLIVVFLPGPAILIIPVGIAILATEFVWAEKLLHQFKFKVKVNSILPRRKIK